MDTTFQYDVFLSHSSKDKPIVRAIAERLRADGLKVWFDEWVLKPGDSILAQIENGLEHSRVLVLCMSASAFDSDWAQLESGTFRFRDPLNRERRSISLLLDPVQTKSSLGPGSSRDKSVKRITGSCRAQSRNKPTIAPNQLETSIQPL